MKTLTRAPIKSTTSRTRRTIRPAAKTVKFQVAENLAALCGKYRDALSETTEFLRIKHHETLRER